MIISVYGITILGTLYNMYESVVLFIICDLIMFLKYCIHFIYIFRSSAIDVFYFIPCIFFVLLISLLSNSINYKKLKYKNEGRDTIKKLSEETEKLSIKNKFIGALTHEIRNFVTK